MLRVLLISCAFSLVLFWVNAESNDASSSSGESERKPWIPLGIMNKKNWRAHFESQKQMIQNNSVTNSAQLLFIGDSITHGWLWGKWKEEDWGKEVWDKNYAKKAINLGIGGDKTENVLWRLEHLNLSLLTNPPPKVAIVCIGTNNIGKHNSTVADIAKGIEAVVFKLREVLPSTKVLLLAIFPRSHAWPSRTLININYRISRMDPAYQVGVNVTNNDAPGMIRFLDMGTHFAKAIGHVEPELYLKDQLHLNKNGYKKWAEVMNKTLVEMTSSHE